MEKFQKAIRDAEKHLEFSEKSLNDLNRRIQQVESMIKITEQNVEDSLTAITASEKKLSSLSAQQGETKKKLSSLYYSLIAIPTLPHCSSSSGSVTNELIPTFTSSSPRTSLLGAGTSAVVIARSTSSGSGSNSRNSSRSNRREYLIWQYCYYNSMVTVSEVDSLLRHSYFVQARVRQSNENKGIDYLAIGGNEKAEEKKSKLLQLQPQIVQMSDEDKANENENSDSENKQLVDVMTPLCIFDLTGTCTDENCCFQHLGRSTSSSIVATGKKSNGSSKSLSNHGRTWRTLKLKKFLKQKVNSLKSFSRMSGAAVANSAASVSSLTTEESGGGCLLQTEEESGGGCLLETGEDVCVDVTGLSTEVSDRCSEDTAGDSNNHHSSKDSKHNVYDFDVDYDTGSSVRQSGNKRRYFELLSSDDIVTDVSVTEGVGDEGRSQPLGNDLNVDIPQAGQKESDGNNSGEKEDKELEESSNRQEASLRVPSSSCELNVVGSNKSESVFVEFMNHCQQLWASCFITSTCRFVYKWLHLECVELLPFSSLPGDNNNNSSGGSRSGEVDGWLADGIEEFVYPERESTQEEVNILYAALVYLLVTGDFIGSYLAREGNVTNADTVNDNNCDSDISQRGAEDRGQREHSCPQIVVFSSMRRKRTELKLKSLLIHSPDLFEKIIFLLQQAHDAMQTRVKINYLKSNKKLSLNLECSKEAFQTGSARDEGLAGNSVSVPLSHQVLWWCTSLVAEVACVNSSAHSSSLSIESAVMLAKFYFSLAPPAYHTVALEAPDSEGGSHPWPYLDDMQSIPLRTSCNLLSINATKEVCKHWETQKSAISGSAALTVLTQGYLSGDISLETFSSSFIDASVSLLEPERSAQKSSPPPPCIVFTHSSRTWKLSVCPSSHVETNYVFLENNISNSSTTKHVRLSLITQKELRDNIFFQEEFSELVVEQKSTARECSGDSDSDSDESSCDEEVELSDGEILLLLKEVFTDIFSIRVFQHSDRLKKEIACDVNMLIGLWLIIGRISSCFDVSQLHPHSHEAAARRGLQPDRSSAKACFCTLLILQKHKCLETQVGHPSGLLTSTSVDSIGAIVLKCLFIFARECITNIAALPATSKESARNRHVESLLSLVVSVLVSAWCSTASRSFSDLASPLTNIFQSTLYVILIELRNKKLLSLKHIEFLLLYIHRRGSGEIRHNSNAGRLPSLALQETLVEFYEKFPVEHTPLLHGCYTGLLSGDVFDLIFEVLDEHASVEPNCWFYLSPNNSSTSSIERFCLKISPTLQPLYHLTSSLSLSPRLLFHVAMIFYIAETFENFFKVLKELLQLRNPCAQYYLSRVLTQCLGSESSAYQVELLSDIRNHCSTSESNSNRSTSDNNMKWRRVLPNTPLKPQQRWRTYLVEEGIQLFDATCSQDKLIYLSEFLTTFSPSPSNNSSSGTVTSSNKAQGQPLSVDLTNFSSSGFLPSCFRICASHSLSQSLPSHQLVDLNLSMNNFTSFPLVILDVASLTKLDLSWNTLSSMPSNIDKLSNLQVLNISHNMFTYFPSSILKLKSSLSELYLQDNRLEEIKNDFLKLSQLRVLDVSNNRLKSIPSRLSSHIKLNFFRFSGNPIHDMQNKTPSLHSSSSTKKAVPEFSKYSASVANKQHLLKKKRNNLLITKVK